MAILLGPPTSLISAISLLNFWLIHKLLPPRRAQWDHNIRVLELCFYTTTPNCFLPSLLFLSTIWLGVSFWHSTSVQVGILEAKMLVFITSPTLVALHVNWALAREWEPPRARMPKILTILIHSSVVFIEENSSLFFTFVQFLETWNGCFWHFCPDL